MGARLGVAFLPQTIATLRRTPAVALVLLDEPGTQWHMALVWRRGGYLSGAARAWVDLTREVYGTAPGMDPTGVHMPGLPAPSLQVPGIQVPSLQTPGASAPNPGTSGPAWDNLDTAWAGAGPGP